MLYFWFSSTYSLAFMTCISLGSGTYETGFAFSTFPHEAVVWLSIVLLSFGLGPCIKTPLFIFWQYFFRRKGNYEPLKGLEPCQDVPASKADFSGFKNNRIFFKHNKS